MCDKFKANEGNKKKTIEIVKILNYTQKYVAIDL